MSSRPRLIHALSVAHAALRRRVAAEGGPAGGTAASAALLFVLAERGPLRMGDLARAMSASNAGVSGLVDRMSERGLVVRTPSPDDRRVLVVDLTDAGREALTPASRAAAQIMDELVEGFSDDEVAVVARWLQHVATLG